MVLSFLEEAEGAVAVSDVINYLQSADASVSRMTVNRDLRELRKRNYIIKSGSGRGAVYSLNDGYQAVKPINIEKYFALEPDKRQTRESFNFNIFSIFNSVFTPSETKQLEKLNELYQKNLNKLSATVLKREYERLTIDLSWKSSKIEGNTYTLLETEYLLHEHKEPKGHTREETQMILNHKAALDYIRARQTRFAKLDIRDIEDVHSLLIKNLGVARKMRDGIVRITGTEYKPIDNKFQIKEAMEKLCGAVNKQKNPFTKALIAMLAIAYIQPFEDGNKRASRLIGNALLIAHDACPLSFRSIDELEYKKAILLFYEQNNFRYFKELFISQFEFAVKNYFG